MSKIKREITMKSDKKIIEMMIDEKTKLIGEIVEDIYEYTKSLDFDLETNSRSAYYLDSIMSNKNKFLELLKDHIAETSNVSEY